MALQFVAAIGEIGGVAPQFIGCAFEVGAQFSIQHFPVFEFLQNFLFVQLELVPGGVNEKMREKGLEDILPAQRRLTCQR